MSSLKAETIPYINLFVPPILNLVHLYGLAHLCNLYYKKGSINTCICLTEFNSSKLNWIEFAYLFTPQIPLPTEYLDWSVGSSEQLELDWIPIRIWGRLEAANHRVGGVVSVMTFCTSWGCRVKVCNIWATFLVPLLFFSLSGDDPFNNSIFPNLFLYF